MKIANLLVAGSMLLGASVYAQEETAHHEAEAPYYITVKGVYAFGEDYENEKGDAGYGIGIDLGYELGHGLAVELDGTYESADVEILGVSTGIDYYATSLDLVYVYEITEKFGLLAKVGAEYEYETAEGESSDDTGISYAVGMEYVFNKKYNGVIEYEGSSIDGPKGDSVMAGVKFKF